MNKHCALGTALLLILVAAALPCAADDAGEASGFPGDVPDRFRIRVKTVFDGYDTSVRYVDTHVGYLFELLDRLGVLEDTAIIISADHGENLGELNIYCGHRMADQSSARQPLIVRWPGITSPTRPGVDQALHYQFDLAATVIELVGGTVPENWDAVSFAEAFKSGEESGRDYLVVSAGAASFTRSVRFDDHLCIRLYHDGYQCFPNDVLLFDVKADPHEQHDLSDDERYADVVARLHKELQDWQQQVNDPVLKQE